MLPLALGEVEMHVRAKREAAASLGQALD